MKENVSKKYKFPENIDMDTKTLNTVLNINSLQLDELNFAFGDASAGFWIQISY